MTRLSATLASPAWRAAAALLTVILLGFVFHAQGAFWQWGTHRDMLRQIAVPGILACGMTVVILTGGIDLAVGSVLGLTAVVFSLLTLHWGWTGGGAGALALAGCLLLSSATGAASAGFIARYRVQPFIATLAMMVFARGLAKFVSGGQKISSALPLADGTFKYVELPALFATLDSKVWGGNITVVTLIFLVASGLTWALISRHRYGRYLLAVGGNEEASRLSGVPVARVKVVAYAFSGLMAGLAGLCQAVQEQQGDPEAGVAYELTAIAMVVIGGTSLRGGRGGMGLTLLGVLTIGYLEKILSINAIGEPARLMLTGGILITAVLFQTQSLSTPLTKNSGVTP